MKFDRPRGFLNQTTILSTFSHHIRKLLVFLFLCLVSATTFGRSTPSAEGMELVEVNWLEEMRTGGWTMVALGLLSVALLAFTVERALFLRRRYIVPDGLALSVQDLFQQGRYQEIIEKCRAQKSILGDVITHLVSRRYDELTMLAQSAADLGARELNRQDQRNLPFAVIATLAPLLGLLGTMIGMIESFKLVEVFGDEGGASMLAGSISKALITTAGGLVLAVPSVILFNLFKYRLNELGARLEEEVESLMNAWFKPNPGLVEAPPVRVPTAQAVAEPMAFAENAYIEPGQATASENR